MAKSVSDLRSKAELDNILSRGGVVVLHFWASWCAASAQMDAVLAQLCSEHPHFGFYRVEAEDTHGISEAYEVSAVPFVVFTKDGVVVDKLEGADPAKLASKVARLGSTPDLAKESAPASLGMVDISTTQEAGQTLDEDRTNGPNGDSHKLSEITRETLHANGTNEAEPVENNEDSRGKLQNIVASKPIMLFMKGTPEEPRCGFSRRVLEILKEMKVEFGSFDILSDEGVRQGMKAFSNWPTYPQLYVSGEFIGGCDIVTEMHKSGELKEVLAEKGLLSMESMESKLKKLIYASPTMLFMKGTPDAPRCGFSSKVVNALKEESISFGSFDILSDDEVRQGLKTYSNWPTYPQLYHNGELIGGCDIILEMRASGELKSSLS